MEDQKAAHTNKSSKLLIKDVLQKTTMFFREKGIESARLDAELLIADAMKWERMKIYLNYEYPLNETELSLCRESVRRRASGEPVAYILGKRDFYNHTFKVSSAVLIPRPETEQIVEEVVPWLRAQETQRVVDLGAGSGCIGLSILAEIPEAKLVSVDISAKALEVARANAEELALTDRSHFLEGDAGAIDVAAVVDALGGAADAVVANPPYIAENDPQVEKNVRLFEPQIALFADDAGLAQIRSWCRKAADLLRPGGWVMFEIGHEQGQAAKEIFDQAQRYTEITIVKDLSQRDRFIRARKET